MDRRQKYFAQTGAECGTGKSVKYSGASAGQVNVGKVERALSAIGGGVLVKRNLGKFSVSGIAKLLAGAALMRRGITGHCDLYETMNIDTAGSQEKCFPGASEKAIPVRAEMTVEVPPRKAYELWREPANQSWIMGHLARVDSVSVDRAHWKLRGPFGLEWDALIVADSPGEFISWESLPGAGMPNEGSIRFVPTETGGTRILYESRFDPPTKFGLALLGAMGITPERLIGKALYRFKTMAEMEPAHSTGYRKMAAREDRAVPATT